MRHGLSTAVAAALLATTLALSGCAPSGSAVGALAKATGWPDGVGNGTQLPNDWYAQLEVAYDSTTARALWDSVAADHLPAATGRPEHVGRYGDLADLDFTTQVVGAVVGRRVRLVPGVAVLRHEEPGGRGDAAHRAPRRQLHGRLRVLTPRSSSWTATPFRPRTRCPRPRR